MASGLKKLKARLTPEKIKRKIRDTWHNFWSKTKFYKYTFASYWHGRTNKKYNRENTDVSQFYLTQRVYEGAGIGHQMTCWITAIYAAKTTGLSFAHYPFSDKKWEELLGFHYGEKSLRQLKKEGYKIVNLKTFDIDNVDEDTWRTICSYSGKKTAFFVEGFRYQSQCGMEAVLKDKFYNSPSRKQDNITYAKDVYNIAVHIRRGDIVGKDGKAIASLAVRFQGLDYFYNAAKTAIEDAETDKDIHVYLFSQGSPEDFKMFEELKANPLVKEIHYCMDMDQYASFVHLVYADALIMSRSSFSYNPALISTGKKYGAPAFWHDYPVREDWKQLDEEGHLV